MLIPRGLLAADPSQPQAEEVDVLVVGSGVAGLSAALAVPPGRTVCLATKDRLGHSATRYAQGGIAAVLDLVGDSVAEHVADTLAAGAGLCDPVAVQLLVEEGGQAIADLRELGVGFDPDPSGPGELAQTREGGHSRSRVVHAGGDATGAELERALTEAVRATPSVHSVEHAFLVDLLTTDGRVTGALLWIDGRPRVVRAGAVVLASGGAGQLFADTTNPPLSTGDGIAAALRAGAVLADLEFVQFHPTALHVDGEPDPPGDHPAVPRTPPPAHLRGHAGRGGGAPRRRRDTGHGRRPPPRRPGPPRRRHPGRRRPHGRHRGQAPVAGRDLDPGRPPGAPLPDHPGPLPRRRHRPLPPADPGLARRALPDGRRASPTSTGAPASPACSPSARPPAPASTAPTASPPTPSSRAWSSPPASVPPWPRTPTRRVPGQPVPGPAAPWSGCRARRGGGCGQRGPGPPGGGLRSPTGGPGSGGFG